MPDNATLGGGLPVRFHIHTTYQARDGQLLADHHMDGQVELEPGTRQTLNAHPHAQGDSNPCLWHREESGAHLVLPATAVQDVAAAEANPILAAVGSCAQQLGGHVVFWGL